MKKVAHISLYTTQWKIQIVKKSQSLVPNLGFYVPTNTLLPWKKKKSDKLLVCHIYDLSKRH